MMAGGPIAAVASDLRLHDSPAPNADALVHRIGGLIVSDPRVGTVERDRYALVAAYGGATLRLSGFAYAADGSHIAATPDSAELADAINALRAATQVEGKAPWQVAVFRIVRDARKVTVHFEYDAPERWDITPQTLDDVATRARPA
jgi:hypothetical protein